MSSQTNDSRRKPPFLHQSRGKSRLTASQWASAMVQYRRRVKVAAIGAQHGISGAYVVMLARAAGIRQVVRI